MEVCMIVLNTFVNDTRVYKEAKSLAGAGNTVTIFAYKDDEVPAFEKRDGFSVERIPLYFHYADYVAQLAL